MSEFIGSEFDGALHWLDSIQHEPAEITQTKTALLERLSNSGIPVPGVLFTEQQVLEAIRRLVDHEGSKYNNDNGASLEYNPLYITITPGGDRLANALYSGISMFAKGRVDHDSIAIDPRAIRSDKGTRVLKPLDARTKIFGRDIVFVDTAIRSGTLLRTIARRFMEADWTIRNLLSGGTPRSVSAISLTAREDIKKESFYELQDLSVGLITPSGIRSAGWGANDIEEYLRMLPDIVIAPHQLESDRDRVAEVLKLLGDRAIGNIEINFLPVIN